MSDYALIHAAVLSPSSIEEAAEASTMRTLLLSDQFLDCAENMGRFLNARIERFWNEGRFEPEMVFYGWSVAPQGTSIHHILSGSVDDDAGRPLHFIHKSLKKAIQQALALTENLDILEIESVLVLRGSAHFSPVDQDTANGICTLELPENYLGLEFSTLNTCIVKEGRVSVNTFDHEGRIISGSLCPDDMSHIAIEPADINDFYATRLNLENLDK
jgi:hypothetical protein